MIVRARRLLVVMLGLATAVGAAACSGDGFRTDEPDSTVSAEPTTSASALATAEPPQCADEPACFQEAARVLGDGDRRQAITLYERGCKLQPYSGSCSELARAYLQTPVDDYNHQLSVLRMSCKSARFNLIDSCIGVAKMALDARWSAEERDSLLHEAGTYACLGWAHPETTNWGATAATKDRAGLAELCNTFGHLPPIEEKGLQALGEACKLDNKVACARIKAISELGSPKPVPGANLSDDEEDIDGIAADDLSCKVSARGAKPKPADVLGSVRARVTELEACGWGTLRVRFTQKGGKGGTVTKVEAFDPDATLKACVEKALLGAPSTVEADCLVTLDFSPSEDATDEEDTAG